MPRNFVYESFEDYMNYVLLIESEDCESCGKKSLNEDGKPGTTTPPKTGTKTPEKPKAWEFQFDSGKFKKSEVTEEQKKILENDFLTRVVPVLDNPMYVGKKLKISLEAASSKVPIRPGGTVATALKSAGYSPDNEGLCSARAKTVTDLIGDIIFKKYAPKGADKDKFLTGLKDKIIFEGIPKANIGDEYNPDVDKGDDPKYKKYQYISALLTPVGGDINKDRIIPCNSDTKYEGSVATKENGYIGYDKTVYLSAKSGQKVTIEFDPKTVPDSILFQYFGTSKLSPFAGSIGRTFVRGLATPENIATLDKMISEGKSIPYEKRKIQGKEYLVQDYKKYLNETVNKGGSLVNSIEKKLKSLGLKTIKEVCPEFFDQEGKIEVYATNKPEDIKADPKKVEELKNTADLIIKGLLPGSPVIEKTKVSIEVTKNLTADAVTLVAFSPISGTLFNLKTKCE